MGGTGSPSGTTTAALDEDIKTVAREALVPSELEQHLAMNRARLIKYEQFRSEIQGCIEARRIKSHFRELLQRALQLRWMWTALAKKGKKGNKGKTGKGDGKNGKIGGKGQNQSQNPNPSKDAVCWLESKESVWLWWNPKTKEAKETCRPARAREQARWNSLGKPRMFNGESAKDLFTDWLRNSTGVSDCCVWLSFPASD